MLLLKYGDIIETDAIILAEEEPRLRFLIVSMILTSLVYGWMDMFDIFFLLKFGAHWAALWSFFEIFLQKFLTELSRKKQQQMSI